MHLNTEYTPERKSHHERFLTGNELGTRKLTVANTNSVKCIPDQGTKKSPMTAADRLQKS